MARIQTYDFDTTISDDDFILGSDGDNNNSTKNYPVITLKNHIINGLQPEVGGTLKITEVIGDTGENTPQAVINALDPAYAVAPYEIVIVVTDNDEKYIFKKNNDIFGVDETQTVLSDFISLNTNHNIDEVLGFGNTTDSSIIFSAFNATGIINNYQLQYTDNANNSTTFQSNGIISRNSVQNSTSLRLPVSPLNDVIFATPLKTNGTYTLALIDDVKTYTAGTGIQLIGTAFSNTAPDQTVVLNAGSGITISGTYPNFTITANEIETQQKVITYPTDFVGNNYTLTNSDNNFEIIINNGAIAVTITVPSGLSSKIGVGFTQKGTGDVSYIESGTTINNPIGLKIKGQYYQTYLSQEANTDIFFLGGNTKA